MSAQAALTVFSCPKFGMPRSLIRFLGSARGIITHFRGKAPTACPGEALCRNHQDKPKFKAYAPGQLWEPSKRVWEPRVIEMPLGLCELVGVTGIRGQAWEIYRVQRKYGSRAVEGELIHCYDQGDLPRQFCVVRTVEALYSMRGIEFDVPIEPWLHESGPISHDAPPPRREAPSEGKTYREEGKQLADKFKRHAFKEDALNNGKK